MSTRTEPLLHVHFTPLAPVGRRRLPLVRAGHAAAGTAAARAVVLVGGVLRGGAAPAPATAGAGHLGEHQARRRRGRAVRRRGDAQRRQQRLAHGHRGQGDRANRQRHGPRGVHCGRGKRRVQHSLADAHDAAAASASSLVSQRARQVGVHFLDRRQHHLCGKKISRQ